ncbi:hypothetical protein MHB48_08880 [Psychrobacillus sp. FSL H8-0483]|uniref:SF0329 family protein n=1 Tax=Psychrobacillus sp. FSL H8-0483 TaxID=2921389 RepID=UPI003159D857
MRWTKTKMLIENLICEKLNKRLKVNATSYNTSLGEQRRIWITLDKKEIFNASSAHFLNAHDKLWDEVRNRTSKPFPDCLYECFPELVGKENDLDYSLMILEQRNIFNVNLVYDSLVQYSNFSIEDALISKDIIVQALALIDKRLGKRRLENLEFNSGTHPLVMKFFQIRCEGEGISNSNFLTN